MALHVLNSSYNLSDMIEIPVEVLTALSTDLCSPYYLCYITACF